MQFYLFPEFQENLVNALYSAQQIWYAVVNDLKKLMLTLTVLVPCHCDRFVASNNACYETADAVKVFSVLEN